MTRLAEDAVELGVRLSSEQLASFDLFRGELIEWNERINLTAIVEPAQIECRHFLDSLACLMADIPLGASIIDVGSGAGFPGLPLKIARPDLRVTLLEATSKKVRFLEHVCAALGLTNTTVINGRAEDLDHWARYDVAVARALASTSTVVELTLPFVVIGGRLLAMKKGPNLETELAGAKRCVDVLGGRWGDRYRYTIAGEPRQIVSVTKAAATPAGFPRRAGMPSKRPL